jgi:hypothetical protein
MKVIKADDHEAVLQAAKAIRADRAEVKRVKRETRSAEHKAKMNDRLKLMADAPAKFYQANDSILTADAHEPDEVDSYRSEVQEFVRLMADLYMVHPDCVGLVLLRIAFPDWTYDNMSTFLKIDKAGVVRRMKIMKDEFPLMYEFARSKSRIGGPRDMP